MKLLLQKKIFVIVVISCSIVSILAVAHIAHSIKAKAQREKNEKLSSAFSTNDVSAIKFWLNQGSDINDDQVKFGKQTPLILAILNNQEGLYEEIINILINNPKININQSDIEGKTPLMFAAQYERWATVRLLLEHGADPNLVNKSGETALSLIYQKYSTRLLDQQAGIESGGCISNQSCLDIEEDERTIKLLLQYMIKDIQDQELRNNRLNEIIQDVLNTYGKKLRKIVQGIST